MKTKFIAIALLFTFLFTTTLFSKTASAAPAYISYSTTRSGGGSTPPSTISIGTSSKGAYYSGVISLKSYSVYRLGYQYRYEAYYEGTLVNSDEPGSAVYTLNDAETNNFQLVA